LHAILKLLFLKFITLLIDVIAS